MQAEQEMTRDESEAEPAIGVLLYVNRSGSTLLSRLISERCAGVFVFPEVGFPIELLLATRAGRTIGGGALEKLIASDPRTPAIGIPEGALVRICREHSSADIGALLAALATAVIGTRPTAIVIKHEKLGYLIETMATAIRHVRYIHIIRDPRAVASSMLRTPVPEKPRVNMARGSVLYAARHWRDYVSRIQTLAPSRHFVEVRYEDLRQDEGRGACLRIAGVLGVPMRADAADAEQVQRYRIAAIDHALHEKIHAPFDERRTSGWRTELSSADVQLIEATCRNLMEAADYPTVTITENWTRKKMLRASLRHSLAMTLHAISSLAGYFSRQDRYRAIRVHVGLARIRRDVRKRDGNKSGNSPNN